jgi:hypothetical protein
METRFLLEGYKRKDLAKALAGILETEVNYLGMPSMSYRIGNSFFRCFLLRLGYIGDEYKEARKMLLQHLSGSSSHRYSKEEGLHATISDSELRRTPTGNCLLSGLTGSLCRHAWSA